MRNGRTGRWRWRRARGSSWWRRGGAAWGEVAQTKPGQNVVGLFRDGVANTLRQDRLNIGAEGCARVSGEWIVGNIRSGSLTDAEHVRPLFDILPEILRIQCGVAV